MIIHVSLIKLFPRILELVFIVFPDNQYIPGIILTNQEPTFGHMIHGSRHMIIE